MARTNAATHAWRRLQSVDLYVTQTGTIGDTVTTAPIVGDGSETTIAVSAITNFTAADPIIVNGDGGIELFKAGTPNVTFPVSYKPKIPQSTGARFYEAQKITLGRSSEDGVVITPSKSLTPVFSAMDDFPVFYIESPIELGFSFAALEYAGKNLQLMLGYVDEETGVGSAADPFQNVIGKLNQALIADAVLRVTGQLQDGKFVQIDALGCRFEANQGITHARKAPPPAIPIACKVTKGIWREATAAFTN